MYFCAMCPVKNCAKKFGEEEYYPNNCPTMRPEIPEILEMYKDSTDQKLAQVSAVCSPDHSECRVMKTIRFAKECGFKKIGLAFCITLADDAKNLSQVLRKEGFEVESVICKVGHHDRTYIGAPCSNKAMCNPIAQAELLNGAKTDLNIILGLCVGHDTLFIRHSEAPITVLAAKDHVYENAPMEFFKKQKE